MNQQQHYTQPYQTAPTHRYPSTSSAFSASANPNEDWTKITDLAERRRIQNRIAQRNYRKKLKKRLEDLEKRAASNSESPEQKPAELDSSVKVKRNSHVEAREAQSFSFDSHPTQPAAVQFMPFDDRSMFSQQYTRQLSTSPPPFAYSGYSADSISYPPYSADLSYGSLSTSADMPIFPAELPPLSTSLPTTLASMSALDFPAKQEPFFTNEMAPYGFTYGSMPNIDIAAQSYSDSNPHTPPLSDCFEQSVAGSPPELSMPTTPPFTTTL